VTVTRFVPVSAAHASLAGNVSPLPNGWRIYVRCLPDTRTPRAAYAHRGGHHACRCRGLADAGLFAHATVKERDFLIHWIADPSTSHPEMLRITQAGQP